MADAELNLVVIRSADLALAANFYEAIGVHLSRERHGSGPEHLTAKVGTAVLEVYPLGGSGNTLGVRLGFQVASVSAVIVAIQAAGGSVVTAPKDSPWGFRAVVVDPDGHRIELVDKSACA